MEASGQELKRINWLVNLQRPELRSDLQAVVSNAWEQRILGLPKPSIITPWSRFCHLSPPYSRLRLGSGGISCEQREFRPSLRLGVWYSGIAVLVCGSVARQPVEVPVSCVQ